MERIKRFLYKWQYNNIVAELLYEGKKEKDLMPFEEWYLTKTKKTQ